MTAKNLFDPRPLAPTRTARRGLRIALAAAALTLACSAPALAQDKATAESLFQAGKQLMAEGKTEEACPKFEASQRADPSPGTLVNLAKCHETLGKTASAWAGYKAAATLARAQGRTDLAEGATSLAAELEPKLSKLSIQATAVEGLEIKRDGAPISLATLGVPIAVDPGEHLIEASAPGYAPYSMKITVASDASTATLEIPELERSAAVPPGDGTLEAGGSVGGTITPTKPSSNTLRTVSYIVGGVGVVGLGVGTAFGLMASGQVSDAESDPALCPNKQCTTAGRSEIDSAGTKAGVSTAALIGGGALLATGVVLFLVSSPKKTEGATTARFIPAVGPHGGGFSLLGQF